MKRKLFISSLVIFFLFTGFNLFAQSFKASVDRTTIGLGQNLEVDFTFSNGDLNQLSEFSPPSFSNANLLSGPNESRSMQIINGQVSGTLTYSFIVHSNKIGKLTIGSASIKYKGKKLTSNSIRVNVVKASSAPQTVPSNAGISNQEIARNVFIRAIPNKRNVLQGEQITVNYKLYTRLNISSPQISKLPNNKGFWAEELDTKPTIRFNYEMYKGQRFRSAVIKKVALFPTKSGKLTITPFELRIPVIVRKKRSNDLFDNFFNDSFFGRAQTIDYLAKSNKVTINVAPLPTEGKPESFNGSVGKFNIKATIDKQKVKANEAISLELTISGSGNIALLEIPKLKLPPGFEKYEPKTSQVINRKNIVSGRKTIEYLIVPRIPGEKIIPPIEFSYFDPSQMKYITKTTPSFKINVEQSENDYANNTSGYSKEDIKLLSKDIRFIKTSFNLQKKKELQVINGWFWFTIIVPLLILISLIVVQKRQNKLLSDVSLLKFQRAEKIAKNKLKFAQKALESGNNEEYYNGLSQAIFGYLENKLNIQKSEFTKEKAINRLRELNVDEYLIKEVEQISGRCEFARFAPNSQSRKSEKELYDNTVKVIQELQNSITTKKIRKK